MKLENDVNRRYLLDNLEKEQLADMVLIKMDQIKELKKAIEPLVIYANSVKNNWLDDTVTCLLFKQEDGTLKQSPSINLGHCRLARDIYNKLFAEKS